MQPSRRVRTTPEFKPLGHSFQPRELSAAPLRPCRCATNLTAATEPRTPFGQRTEPPTTRNTLAELGSGARTRTDRRWGHPERDLRRERAGRGARLRRAPALARHHRVRRGRGVRAVAAALQPARRHGRDRGRPSNGDRGALQRNTGSHRGFAVDRRTRLRRRRGWLGWLGALAAAVTAYIRVLGGSLGLPQDFRGPLAKPHRMVVMTSGVWAERSRSRSSAAAFLAGRSLDRRAWARCSRAGRARAGSRGSCGRARNRRRRTCARPRRARRPRASCWSAPTRAGSVARRNRATHLLRESHEPHRHAGDLGGAAAAAAPANASSRRTRLLGHGLSPLHRHDHVARGAHRPHAPGHDHRSARATARDARGGRLADLVPRGHARTARCPVRSRAGCTGSRRRCRASSSCRSISTICIAACRAARSCRFR